MKNQLLKFLDELVVIENQSAQTALVKARGYYKHTRYTLFALATIVFIMVITIAVIVIRLVASKNREVSYQAMHDPLTNLYNRCYFEHQIHEAIIQCKKDGSQHALLYMDLDQFKVVNDTCGHVAGDELLKQVTSLLKNKIRKTDTLARLGGDEFGLLIINCDTIKAVLLGEELKTLINEYRFFWDEKLFAVGVSIGVALINKDFSDLKEILIAADTACYAAKDAGRNLVHVYDVDFKQYVHKLFRQYKVSGQQICFEITETAAITSFDKAIHFMEEFQKEGCRFSLDDFGSGLSSFAYLKQLPVDILKIDGLFVHNIDIEPIDYAMVKSINEIAHLYGKKTVAEVVESEAVFEKLSELGVDYAQGYAISRPVPIDQIIS